MTFVGTVDKASLVNPEISSEILQSILDARFAVKKTVTESGKYNISERGTNVKTEGGKKGVEPRDLLQEILESKSNKNQDPTQGPSR